ncbi:unnamed protein product [Pleuronectes platessa]|uniref:Uncharacterized protein n=1 Tax=Pleuronectes platessa TaxID=8262 RepID=A0A9N7VJM8_PLEPL|nr:unnamed protein product [Pleuronectes platessa]
MPGLEAGDPSPPRRPGMADGRQPDEHWASNGRENGENGYSAYGSGYKENGFHGGAAAHPGTTVDESANLPPSPPPSPSAEQIGPVAQGTHTETHTRPSSMRFQGSVPLCMSTDHLKDVCSLSPSVLSTQTLTNLTLKRKHTNLLPRFT